jgi:hypothetical protein
MRRWLCKVLMMSELQRMNQAKTIMIGANDNDNAKRLSCSASGGGWGTGTPLSQAGGVCVYIESAPHAGLVNKA